MKGSEVSENVEIRILEIRGQRVMLDADLARLYGAETRALLQAVKRHSRRFPEDFMFRLSEEDLRNLTSQSVISSGWGGRRHMPLVFTEQGVAMLSGVLRSDQAIDVNIAIMRAFVRLRHRLVEESRLSNRVDQLEKKYDGQFRVVFEALDQLLALPEQPARRIGFETEPGE